MRKFVRIALIVCLVVTAIPIVLIAPFGLWAWYKTSQVERFYREHPLLGEMRARQPNGTNDSLPARQALLEIAPLGTNKEAAIAALIKEGFVCQTIPEPVTDTRLRQRFMEARGLTNIPNNSRTKDVVDCQTGSPALVAYTTWITHLEFDTDGRLSEARVATWTIFI